MTTLHDRLADLAEDAGTAPPGADNLWKRGRRQHRRRTAATAGIFLAVALVATAGAAGLAGRTLHEVEPAVRPASPTVLPDRFFEPSGRLPVAHDGTGPLVALIPAEHFSWTGRGKEGLVGVSAVDQSYSFLDLPGFIGTDLGIASWSLSPDGRWVAYWYGDRKATLGDHPADGVAVIDTSSGKVRRYDMGTQLGVDAEPVAWTGDTLWFGEWDYTEMDDDGSAAHRVASYAWPLGEDQPHQVADPHQLLGHLSWPAGVDGFLTAGNGGCCRAIFDEADLAADSPRIRVDVSPSVGASLSPDGHTMAVAQVNDDQGTSSVLVGPVDGSDVQLAPLSADLGSYPRVIGWLDDRHVVVADYRDDGRAIVSADIGTGRTRVLSTFEVAHNDNTQLATDLLRSPVVHATKPPQGHDPRVVAAAVGLGVLVLLWTGLVIRRRRARR